MRKAIQVLLLLIVFSLGLSLPVWADVKWTQPLPPPSCYAGREYTRQHWVDLYVNERMVGAQWNSSGSRILFSGYCSVFDLRPDYNQGYTAVGDNDGVAWNAAMYLDALGVPQVDGWWIVSPSFWREKYGSAPQIFGGSELLSVPAYTVKDESGLDPKSTIDNPKCFKNGPTGGFEAGGYQVWYHNGKKYEQGWHWHSRGSKSPVSITQKYATKMWKADVTTRAEICFNYIYGLSVAGVQPQGSPSGGKQTWQATFYNTTPFIAKNVSLRAYVVQDGKYTLAAQTSTDIGPLPLGNGFGGFQTPAVSWKDGQGVSRSALCNTITWTFETFVPSGQPKEGPAVALVGKKVGADPAAVSCYLVRMSLPGENESWYIIAREPVFLPGASGSPVVQVRRGKLYLVGAIKDTVGSSLGLPGNMAEITPADKLQKEVNRF
ncbi:MAG: hypothetical protein AB1426_03680 [Bacillota bacterium]